MSARSQVSGQCRVRSPARGRVLIAALAALALAALLTALGAAGIVTLPAAFLTAARWAAIAGLAAYAAMRRTVTSWMLVCMVAGAELRHDAPRIPTDLGVLGQIFLRLIKTIIGPLLFATLVVGIAGHSDLRKVGRMGVKALVYFEVITTLALLIGLAAINISRAGVGVHVPPAVHAEARQAAPRLTPSERRLPAFPENAATAGAAGPTPRRVASTARVGTAPAR